MKIKVYKPLKPKVAITEGVTTFADLYPPMEYDEFEVIAVPVSEMHDSPALNHKDFVSYTSAEQELRDTYSKIEGVQGFLNGKAVVVDYRK